MTQQDLLAMTDHPDPPFETHMFRLAVPLAYIRRSKRATRLLRFTLQVTFKFLDWRNGRRDGRKNPLPQIQKS